MVINNMTFAVILVIFSLLAIMSIILGYVYMTEYPDILSVREFLRKYIKDLVSKRFHKKHEKYDLRKEVAAWVEKNIGVEYVDEALDKYDKLNSGVPIGDFQETAVFLHMIERVKMEATNNGRIETT